MHYALRPDTPVSSLPRTLRSLHLVRGVSLKKLKAVLKQCPLLEEIRVSSSVHARLTPAARKALKEKDVIVEKMKAGRALGIDLEVVQQIADLKKDFLSVREISKRVGVPKSTVHYLLKKAKREKVKRGNHVIHVN